MNKYRRRVPPPVRREIVELVRVGWSSRRVAGVIGVSHRTVQVVARAMGCRCCGRPGPDRMGR